MKGSREDGRRERNEAQAARRAVWKMKMGIRYKGRGGAMGSDEGNEGNTRDEIQNMRE